MATDSELAKLTIGALRSKVFVASWVNEEFIWVAIGEIAPGSYFGYIRKINSDDEGELGYFTLEELQNVGAVRET